MRRTGRTPNCRRSGHSLEGDYGDLHSFECVIINHSSVDKDDDDEITKEDWYEALSATGAKVTM